MPPKLSNPFRDEYTILFNSCIIHEDKFQEIDKVISKMVANKATYESVSRSVNIPWNFIAIIHCMEGSLSFKKHLHNGDPLTARTVQVPRGRPVKGKPPFTWEESAVDALVVDGFSTRTDWSIAGMLLSFEKYNGMGYRRKGINSPYLWSYSNHYKKGKFTNDGIYDPEAVSKQCGAAVLLRRMSEKEIAVKGEVDTITMIRRLGEEIVFDPGRYREKASRLQILLNSIGLHLRIDGKAGKNTSDAFKVVTGRFITGDERIV